MPIIISFPSQTKPIVPQYIIFQQLLDKGLPRSTVLEIQKHSIEAIHVGEIGMASASYEEILEKRQT